MRRATYTYTLIFMLMGHVTIGQVPMHLKQIDIGCRIWDWSEWSPWSHCITGKKSRERQSYFGQFSRQEETRICNSEEAKLTIFKNSKKRKDHYWSLWQMTPTERQEVDGSNSKPSEKSNTHVSNTEYGIELTNPFEASRMVTHKSSARVPKSESGNKQKVTYRQIIDTSGLAGLLLSTTQATKFTEHGGQSNNSNKTNMLLGKQAQQGKSPLSSFYEMPVITVEAERKNKWNNSEIKGKCPGRYGHFFLSNDGRGSCYKEGQRWKTWTESRESCKESGGDLVSIESKDESNHMKSTIFASIDFKTLHVYWTSGQYIMAEDLWRWTANGKKINFTNWVPGQPTIMKNTWKYIAVESEGYGWFNADFNAPYTMCICEIDAKV